MERSINRQTPARKESTSSGFAILGTASIICKILAIIYIPFQRHIFNDGGDAIVANGYILFTFLFSLSNAGLPSSLSKMIAHQTAIGNHRASMKILKCAYVVMLVLGILCGGVMLLGAHWIAQDFFKQADGELMILCFSPILIITSVSCALRGYFQGRQNMRAVAVSQVLEQLLNVVFTVVFAWMLIGKGLKYGAAGTTIGTLLGALAAAGFLAFIFFGLTAKQRKREISRQSYDGPEMTTKEIYGQILLYSLPAILSTIATCAPSLIDSGQCIQFLENAGFNGKVANRIYGIYSYQYQRLFTLAIAFSTALVTALIPAVSSALAVKDFKLVRHRINESYKAIYIITVPSIFGLSFLAQPMLSMLLFDLKAPGANLVIFGTWTAILMTIQYVQSSILIAVGRPIVASVNPIIGMVFKVFLNFILMQIPSINIGGAIIGTAVGWFIAIILNQYAIHQSFKFKIYFIRLLFKPALASLVMGAACLLVYNGFAKLLFLIFSSHIPYLLINDVSVLLAIGIGIGVYFTVMIFIGGVKKGDITRLPLGTRICRLITKVPFLDERLQVN